MPVQSINNQQNNLYAANAGIIAGTAGAFAGYKYAPRAAKNMEELLKAKSDVFEKTMENMAKEESPAFDEALRTVYQARLIKETPQIIINEEFPEDKIAVSTLKKKASTILGQTTKSNNNFKKVLDQIETQKGKTITPQEYFKMLEDKKIIKKQTTKEITTLLNDMYGSSIMNETITIDDEFINLIKQQQERTAKALKSQAELLKKATEKQENGFVLKQDLIKLMQDDIEPIAKEVANAGNFENFKKFIPRVNQAKWSAIIGAGAALFTMACVKLFKPEKN